MAAGKSKEPGHARRIFSSPRGVTCALSSVIQLVILSAVKRSRRIPPHCPRFRNGSARLSSEMTRKMYRTDDCNSLRKSDIGRQVALAGWVNVTRDHGGVIFIDLRDREGLTQIVFRPEENAELARLAHTLRS